MKKKISKSVLVVFSAALILLSLSKIHADTGSEDLQSLLCILPGNLFPLSNSRHCTFLGDQKGLLLLLKM